MGLWGRGLKGTWHRTLRVSSRIPMTIFSLISETVGKVIFGRWNWGFGLGAGVGIGDEGIKRDMALDTQKFFGDLSCQESV